VKQAEIRAILDALGIDTSEQQLSFLQRYADLLATRGAAQGLISEADRERVWERHVLDSLRAAPMVGAAGSVIDLGSGGGLPGIPLAIALPDVQVELLERRRGRVAFLELVIGDLGLSNATATLAGTESVQREVDVCTARAFASAQRSWDEALRLLAPAGRLIYFGGKGFEGVGDVPDLARIETVETPVLATSGPLVIMTRT
jgi:16S rRNA (guanine527-N7)-methyltransferase